MPPPPGPATDHPRPADAQIPARVTPRPLLIWLFALLISACGGAPVRHDPPEAPPPAGLDDLEPGASAVESAEAPAARAEVRARLPRIDAERAATCTAWSALATSAGERHGVEPLLLLAVAWVESGFVASARSTAGARGPMQLMPATSRGFGCDDPDDPPCAFSAAAAFLAKLMQRFGGDVHYALASYNTGPGRVIASYRAQTPPPSLWYVERVLAARAGLQRHGCQPPPSGSVVPPP